MIERGLHDVLLDLATLEETLKRVLKLAKERNHHDLTIILVTIDPKTILDEKVEGIATDFMVNSAVPTIKQVIRDNDEIFTLNNRSFLIWLKQTHEAGADFVANRIRRTLTSVAKEMTGHDICFLIATYSEPAALGSGLGEISRTLMSGIELETSCQPIFHGKFNLSCGSQIGPLFLYGTSDKVHGVVDREISSMGYPIVKLDGDLRDVDLVRLLESDERPNNSVVVLGERLSAGEIDIIIKKIRQNRKLDCIFTLVYNEGFTHDNVQPTDGVVIRPDDDPGGEKLVRFVLLGYQMALLKALTRLQATYHSILESIRAASHKLNQPLQIIMGKAELATYGLIEGDDVRSVFEDIKKKVLLVSDLNTKIARIASGQN